MRFAEIDLLGVYVAPIFVMMVAAWPVVAVIERVAVRVGVMRHVWHPSLFLMSAYVIVLSSIVLAVARW